MFEKVRAHSDAHTRCYHSAEHRRCKRVIRDEELKPRVVVQACRRRQSKSRIESADLEFARPRNVGVSVDGDDGEDAAGGVGADGDDVDGGDEGANEGANEGVGGDVDVGIDADEGVVVVENVDAIVVAVFIL